MTNTSSRQTVCWIKRNRFPVTVLFEMSFPQKEDGQHYRLFAFYQKLSGNKNLRFTTNLTDSIFDEGSYVVDHFDAKGAETVINFWEEHILVDGIRERLQRVGHYGECWTTTLMVTPSPFTFPKGTLTVGQRGKTAQSFLQTSRGHVRCLRGFKGYSSMISSLFSHF